MARRRRFGATMRMATSKRSAKSQIKSRAYRHHPKAKMRRRVTRAFGMPTSRRGWSTASSRFYHKYGCFFTLAMPVVAISLLVVLVVSI